MPNSRETRLPIGVFDSGVGGLSILQALRAALPEESFIYVADSGHAPYGDRSAEFIENRVMEVAGFLLERRTKAMVIACNTASVLTARRLRELYAIPIVAMEPAIKPAASMTRSKVILVMATTSTINSQSVARLCQTHGSGIRILLKPCPGLVERIESGDLHGPTTRKLLETFILPALAEGADTIVLGCTHYAFVSQAIAEIAGPSVNIVAPADAIARQLSRLLDSQTGSAPHRVPNTEFYTTGATGRLASFLASIGEPCQQVFELATDGESRPNDLAPRPWAIG